MRVISPRARGVATARELPDCDHGRAATRSITGRGSPTPHTSVALFAAAALFCGDASAQSFLDASPPQDAAPRPVALDASLGARLTHRALRWSDNLFGEQRDYTAPVAPYLTADVQWFPAAHVTASWPAHVGVYASGAFAVGVDSTDSRGRAFDTTAYEVRAGLLGRLPLGLHALTAGVGYERRSFVVAPVEALADPDDPGVAGVTYDSLALDLDARLRASRRVSLSLGATGALPLRFGDLADRLFSGASGASIELRGGVAWVADAGVELRAIASYRRYFLAMNPAPGDRWIAGGLVDEFASLTLSVALRR